MSLSLHFNLGGSLWLQQFLFGFELVGGLSQRLSYPTDPKASRKRPLCPSKLFNTAESRFTDRARKSVRKNSSLLWDEAKEQQEKGWLTQPFPLTTSGAPFALALKDLGVAFRFGVEQGAKLRACDDLRHSLPT